MLSFGSEGLTYFAELITVNSPSRSRNAAAGLRHNLVGLARLPEAACMGRHHKAEDLSGVEL